MKREGDVLCCEGHGGRRMWGWVGLGLVAGRKRRVFGLAGWDEEEDVEQKGLEIYLRREPSATQCNF